MTWRYSGSEQLDPPYYKDEDELQEELDAQEQAEADKYDILRDIEDFD